LISNTIIIITGFSGSGKSTAIAALEDTGFYCSDNLPVALLPQFIELSTEHAVDTPGFAFVMDLRERGFLSRYENVFNELRDQGYRLSILFLEANEKVLVRRYSQTRRQHPLAKDTNVLSGIRAEKEQLQELRKAANQVIDTSYFNVHELKSTILNYVRKNKHSSPIAIHALSFGFKYGVPHDADLLIDVRFLANPYFAPDLKSLTGKSDKVKQFVLNDPNSDLFLKKYFDLLDYLIPLYEKEGKTYLTIAVGCTGGRHRSVTIAQCIYEYLKKPNTQVFISHRDIEQ
jgi:RNase adapter protein RapZ